MNRDEYQTTICAAFWAFTIILLWLALSSVGLAAEVQDATTTIKVDNGRYPEMLRLVASEPIWSVTGVKVVADWWGVDSPERTSRIVFGIDEGGQNIRWSGALPVLLPRAFIIRIKRAEFRDAAGNLNDEIRQTFKRTIKESNQ